MERLTRATKYEECRRTNPRKQVTESLFKGSNKTHELNASSNAFLKKLKIGNAFFEDTRMSFLFYCPTGFSSLKCLASLTARWLTQYYIAQRTSTSFPIRTCDSSKALYGVYLTNTGFASHVRKANRNREMVQRF